MGDPGPQGPAGPAGSGAYTEDNDGFAGFTAASYTGAIGSRSAAHAICAAAFPGAHLCHAAEYSRSNSATPIPATGAWLDASVNATGTVTVQGAPSFGRDISYSCSSFTDSLGSGTILAPSGNISTGNACSGARPLACCNGAPKIGFAGFSAGNVQMSGRPAVNALCSASFPGSHLCHAAEYIRADASATVPASGAYVDASVDVSGTVTVQGSPGFGRDISYSCSSFTDSLGSGTILAPSGNISTGNACNVARPAACCF